MDLLTVEGYWLSRVLSLRGLGLVYLIGFVAALNQFRPLLGARGLLPAPRFLARASWRKAPSIFQLHYSDRFLAVVCWVGIVLSLAVLVGLPERGSVWAGMLVWLALWALYLSIVNVGQVFYSFGWESILLEAGFFAAFLGPSHVAVPAISIFLFRWLLFRVEFGAGLIKLRGDECWRDLTCLYYHHETQPLPNPMSWFFHHLPRPLHRLEVLANHFAQLVAPFGLFFPQPIAGAAASFMILTQGYLVLSGNFAWLNLLTIVLAFSALPDAWLVHLLPVVPSVPAEPSVWFLGIVGAVGLLVLVLSWWPVRNMASRRQRMNFNFNPFHLVGTYGAFGSVTRERYEVILEGSSDADPESAEWRAYEFKAKPGDPGRRPRQVVPYHLRLDWLMWFVPLAPGVHDQWLVPLVTRLLQGDPTTLSLLGHDPFPGEPPRLVRARLYRYRFTTPSERRASGAWWSRTPARLYLPAVFLDEEGRLQNASDVSP